MKKLILCVFSSFIFIFLSFIRVSALSYYNEDGYFTFESDQFNVNNNYVDVVNYHSSPVLGSDISIPSGYSLIAFSLYSGGATTGTANWFYAPSDSSVIAYSRDSTHTLKLSSGNFFKIENRVSASGELSFNKYQSGYYSLFSSGYSRLTLFVPFTDLDGNAVTPESLPQFELNGISTADTFHYSVTSRSSDIGSFDFYLFPSSFLESGGAVTNIISAPTYITEISASEQYGIENAGFASFVDGLQDTYNIVTYGGLLPSIHYFAECDLILLRDRIFDPSSYSLPYVKLGTLNLNNHFHQTSGGQYLDLNAIASSNTGVYAFDNLCIVAIAHKDNRDFLGRLDFSVSALRNSSVVPPSDIIDSNTYQGGTISNLQELANYIKYLFENSDHNLSVEFHNFTAYLQHMPWRSIVEDGVYFGLSDVIPKLQQLEFDTDFDLPALIDDLTPLFASNQLSLPDLTGALAPFFNNFDISPTGNFGTLLSNMDNNLNGHLDSLFTDLSTSVTDLSTEINNNTRTIFVPDFDDMETRLELSGDRLSNKFGFVDDVKDNLEDVRDTIANSSESPPDWHFTVFGVQLFLVDWSVYEPYRGTVKNIFVCIAYILLFKHIYKTIPLNGGDDS